MTGFSHGKNGRSRSRRNAAPYHATGQPPAADLFSDDDYKACIDLMARWCGQYAVEIWAYCYTRRINFARGRRGHLWQAKLVRSPELWPWSSASAHMRGKDDALVRVAPVLSMLRGDWRKFLSSAMSTGEIEDFRRHERTGRPLGGKSFVEQLERSPGRKLAPQKPGRKPKKQKK